MKEHLEPREGSRGLMDRTDQRHGHGDVAWMEILGLVKTDISLLKTKKALFIHEMSLLLAWAVWTWHGMHHGTGIAKLGMGMA